MTLLHLAAGGGHPKVIAVLLNAGADPKALDNDARTPWDLARTNSVLDGTEAYRRLHDARAE